MSRGKRRKGAGEDRAPIGLGDGLGDETDWGTLQPF